MLENAKTFCGLAADDLEKVLQEGELS